MRSLLNKIHEITTKDVPYYVEIPTSGITDEIIEWFDTNDVRMLTEDTGIFYPQTRYRFSNKESATLFKLVFGGRYIDDTIQKR